MWPTRGSPLGTHVLEFPKAAPAVSLEQQAEQLAASEAERQRLEQEALQAVALEAERQEAADAEKEAKRKRKEDRATGHSKPKSEVASSGRTNEIGRAHV